MNVLITGFAGTVGSEFVKQLLDHGHTVTGVNSNEWAVASYPDIPGLTKHLGLASMETGRYDLVIHCAAYKHVELVEQNPKAGYENNVSELLELVQNVKGPLLFISTDKAVEPASAYGKQKQRGERTTREYGGIVARMGNIIGSSGSVIPKWEACLAKGEPLPVTDLEMTRYMLPVEPAVSRILALLPLAKPGQVIVPRMADPVSLRSLVAGFLVAHGAPSSYPIEEIGARPGEKLHEQLVWGSESVVYENENGVIVEEVG